MKSFVVIGCGRFGSSVAKTLYELGNEVMVIDESEEMINEISSNVTHAVQADIMDETVLSDLGLSNFDVAIIAIGSVLEASIMATLAAKELGIKKIIAKSHSDMHSKILLRIGADKVVYPEQDMGVKVAHNLNSSNILDFIEFSPEYSVVEILAHKSWEGKTLESLAIPTRYEVTVIAIRRGEEIMITPKGEDIVKSGDMLVFLGNSDKIEELEAKINR